MKASVIVTAWGESPSGLAKTLDGLNLSAGSVHETVLVINTYDKDPKKTKETVEFASNRKDVTRWAVLSQNIGVARAWNAGAQMTEGEVIVVLNGDCVLGEGAVKTLIEPFSNGSIGVVGVGGLREGRKAVTQGLTESVWGYCFAVRRSCYQETGGFDNAFSPLADEAEFCARAWDKGWGVYIAEGVRHRHEYTISERPDEDILYFGRKMERKALDKANLEYRNNLPWFGKLFHKK